MSCRWDIILLKIKKVTVTRCKYPTLNFDQLQFLARHILKAPSVFNIKDQGLAQCQCILWLKLS